MSWGCTMHQDMASLDGLQGGLKELLGETLRCTPKICMESCLSYTECWGLSRRIQQYVRAVQSGKAELVLIYAVFFFFYHRHVFDVEVGKVGEKHWQAKLRQLTTSSDNGGWRNWSNISFMCKTHNMLESGARSKGISGCLLKWYFILSVAEHSACGHQRSNSTARLVSDLEDVLKH